MLAFTHSAQVAQAQLRSGILPILSGIVGHGQSGKLLYQSQHLFALLRQFACLAGFLQRVGDTGVAVVADEPARTVTSVV